MSSLYFGGFVQKYSFAHSLDARVKLFYAVGLSVFIFSMKALTGLLFASGVLLVILFLAKIGAHYVLKNLRQFVALFLFLFLMYVVFSQNKLVEGVFSLWRFLLLLLLSLVSTYSTPLPEMTLAIERLAAPLKFFGFKPRNIAVMLSIAIRFLPLLLLRFDRLREGMQARLGDLRKLSHLKILVLALLERMFASAAILTDAMSARLYNENAESTRIMRLSKNDYISLGVFFIFVIAVLSAY